MTGYDSFLKLVQEEAEQNVKRLRHHPSLVIFSASCSCHISTPLILCGSLSWEQRRSYLTLLFWFRSDSPHAQITRLLSRSTSSWIMQTKNPIILRPTSLRVISMNAYSLRSWKNIRTSITIDHPRIVDRGSLPQIGKPLMPVSEQSPH